MDEIESRTKELNDEYKAGLKELVKLFLRVTPKNHQPERLVEIANEEEGTVKIIGLDVEGFRCWEFQDYYKCEKIYQDVIDRDVSMDYTDTWQDFLLPRVGFDSQLKIVKNKIERKMAVVDECLDNFINYCKQYNEEQEDEQKEIYACAVNDIQRAEEKEFVIRLEKCQTPEDYKNLTMLLQDRKAWYLHKYHKKIQEFLDLNVDCRYNLNLEQVYEFDDLTHEYYEHLVEDKNTFEEIFNYKLYRLSVQEGQSFSQI